MIVESTLRSITQYDDAIMIEDANIQIVFLAGLLRHLDSQNIALHLLEAFLLRLPSSIFLHQIQPILLRPILPTLRSLLNDTRLAQWQAQCTGPGAEPQRKRPKESTIGSTVKDILTLFSAQGDLSTAKMIKYFVPQFGTVNLSNRS